MAAKRRVINCNVLSVPDSQMQIWPPAVEALEHQSSHVKLIKSDNAQLMLTALTLYETENKYDIQLGVYTERQRENSISIRLFYEGCSGRFSDTKQRNERIKSNQSEAES